MKIKAIHWQPTWILQLKSMMRREELQKYVKRKIPYRQGTSLAWRSQGLNIQVNKARKAGTLRRENLDKD